MAAYHLPYENLPYELFHSIAQTGDFTDDIPKEIELGNDFETFNVNFTGLRDFEMRNVINTAKLGFDSADVTRIASLLLRDVDDAFTVDIDALCAQVFEVVQDDFSFTPADEKKMFEAATLIKDSSHRYLEGVHENLLAHGITPMQYVDIDKELTLETLETAILTTASLVDDGLSLDAILNSRRNSRKDQDNSAKTPSNTTAPATPHR